VYFKYYQVIKDIHQSFQTLTKFKLFQNIIFYVQNSKRSNRYFIWVDVIIDLCDIIFPSKVKNNYTLIEFVHAIIENISYIPQMNTLLKFRVYLFLINNYASVLGHKIDFRETELNLDDEISIDLILDLLKKELNISSVMKKYSNLKIL